MPFGDGTGPAGMGPMTGRAAGYCAGYGVPGYMNSYAGGRGSGWGRGLGFGRGRGYGRGMRRRGFYGNPYFAGGPYPTGPVSYSFAPDPAADPYAVWELDPAQEKRMLQSQARAMEEQLGDMKKRIAELGKDSGENK